MNEGTFFFLFKSEKKTDEGHKFKTDEGGPEKQLTFFSQFAFPFIQFN